MGKGLFVIAAISVFAATAILQTPPQAIARKEPIVAKANGCTITQREFEKKAQKLLPPGFNISRLSPKAKMAIAKRALGECLLLKEAQKRRVKLTKEDWEKIEELKRSLLINRLVEQDLREHPITEKEIENYYNSHKGLFSRKPLVKVRQIVVKDKHTAEKILKQLEKGADFAELAKKFNIDESRNRGGEVGWISPGTFSKAFSQTAFSLKPWQVSGIVHDQFGYHIIRVEGKRPGSTIPLDKVKESIKRILERRRKVVLLNQILNEYKSRMYISPQITQGENKGR